MDLANYKKPREPETIEPIIKYWHEKIPEYLYDVIGTALTGLIVTLPVGIYMALFGHYHYVEVFSSNEYNAYLPGILVGLSGLLKSPGYMIGWALFKGTGAGEWISGGLRWFAITATLGFLT
jgi:hypothetical protein